MHGGTSLDRENHGAGLTATQLERQIRKRFRAEKIFTHPTVIIISFRWRAPVFGQWVREAAAALVEMEPRFDAPPRPLKLRRLWDIQQQKKIRLFVRPKDVLRFFNFASAISKGPAKDP